MIIYKTTNLINNKIYIGQSIKNNSNYLGSGYIFKKAIKKYGKQNFKKEIIETCDSIKELNKREIYWINFYNSTDKNIGYNINEGGKNARQTKESKIKISLALKGKKSKRLNYKHSEETLNKIKESKIKNGTYGISGMLNKQHTEETRNKISEKTIGRKAWNKNLVGYQKGKCITKETRSKISAKLKGKTYEQKYGKEKSELLKSQARERNLGKELSQNTKNKISISLKGISKNQEFKNLISDLKSKPIFKYDLEGNFIKEYKSIKEAKTEHKGDIIACLQGKQKTADKYVWKYKNSI